MNRWIVAAAAASLAGAAAAGPADFQQCDGYGSANEHGDGMTKPAMGFLGLFMPEPGRGTTRAGDVRFSQRGIDACDRALADPKLMPDHWMRRASLHRARAMHGLAAGDHRGALADLDKADAQAAGKGDAYYKRSLGLGTRLLRSYALLRGGDSAEAATLARAAVAERPYSQALAYYAALLGWHANGDGAAYRATLRSGADRFPELLPALMMAEFNAGNFAAVTEIRPQIELTMPVDMGGFRAEDPTGHELRNMTAAAGMDAVAAFALAATGRDADADALIGKRRATIAALTAPPPPRPDGRPPKKEAVARHLALNAQAGEAKSLLAEVEALIGLLKLARAGNTAATIAAMETTKPPADQSGIAILRTIAEKDPAAKADAEAAIGQIRLAIAGRDDRPPLKLEELFAALPEAETSGRIPGYKNAKNIIGEDTGNGFLVKQTAPGEMLINFGGHKSSAAVVEEMALLRAADMARAAGKKGLVVRSRRFFERTIHQVGMYGGGQFNAGYSAEIAVAMVDPDAVPPHLAHSRARVLDADRVYADLAPFYIRATPREAR